MFSVPYVILPFADTPPGEAIRASLAGFQRGGRGEVPDGWLAFHDETETVRRAHEARYTFTDQGRGGLQVKGGDAWHVDARRIRDEVRRRGLERWSVRFADAMDLDTFFDRYGGRLERHPVTGGFGLWRNPLGRWDWWDLGGRFDGRIIGDPRRGEGRSITAISSGPSPGRLILANLRDQLGAALGQDPVAGIDVLSNRNVELVATLLADARAGREHAFPGALVLPPGAVEDGLRWLDTWPDLGPARAFAWLGVPPDAGWKGVVGAAYARFGDHWAAGVAYHH